MHEKQQTEEGIVFSLVRQSASLLLLGMSCDRFLTLVFVWRRFPLRFVIITLPVAGYFYRSKREIKQLLKMSAFTPGRSDR